MGLTRDEDFTRKMLGCMQQGSPHLLQARIIGNLIVLTATNGKRAEIPTAMFYHMTVKEILQRIGIKANDKANRI